MSGAVAIAIVNYCTAELTAMCLRSLEAERAKSPGLRVVVGDNASGDGSVDRLKQVIEQNGWADWVEVLPLPCNGGFAYGNNRIFRHVRTWPDPPRYLMLLNPDTAVRAGAVSRLAAFLDSHCRAAVVGGGLEDEAGRRLLSARRCPSMLSELEGAARCGPLTKLLRKYAVRLPLRSSEQQCDWVSGAAMMIRCEVFEQVGLLDEGYFLYFEELDFCERVRAAGWEVWHEPAARVVHREGEATGIGNRGRRKRYWYDSRRRFFVKRYGWGGLLMADACWAAGRAVLTLRRLLQLGGGRFADDPAMFSYDLLLGDLRAMLSRRETRGNNDGDHALTARQVKEPAATNRPVVSQSHEC